MSEYISPGVFVEEVNVSAKSIEGVSTSTVGFLGETERRPLKPRLLTSFTDFLRVYGSYVENSFLAYAVDGFFRNGGARCYIARIVPDVNADPASRDIPDTANIKSIVARAIGPGVWGGKIIMKFDPGSLASKYPDWFKITIMYFEKDGAFTEFVNWLKKPEGAPTVKPDVLEVYDNLSTDPSLPSNFKKVVNGTSNLVTLWVHADIKFGSPIVKYDKDSPETKYFCTCYW